MNSTIFRYNMMIKEHHLDSFGHVNNATYLEILEEARWDFLTEAGLGMEQIHATNMGPVVLEFHLRFLKELLLRQEIIIESQLLSFDKKIGIMRQDIFNQDHNPCCQAKMTFGFFDLRKRKLIEPNPEFIQAIGGI